MNAAFYRAAIPKPFKILGLSLRPFSLGHEILLGASGNAFSRYSTSEPEDMFPDLALAVRICRRTFSNAIENVMGGDTSFKLWLFAVKHSSIIPKVEAWKFRQYLDHYRNGPDFIRRGDVNSQSVTGASIENVLKVFLCTQMRFTLDQALNYPYCSAITDYLTYMETEGSIRIVDSIDELEKAGRDMQQEIIAKCR